MSFFCFPTNAKQIPDFLNQSDSLVLMYFSYSDLILDAFEGITKVTVKQSALFHNVLLKEVFSNGENKIGKTAISIHLNTA